MNMEKSTHLEYIKRGNDMEYTMDTGKERKEKKRKECYICSNTYDSSRTERNF